MHLWCCSKVIDVELNLIIVRTVVLMSSYESVTCGTLTGFSKKLNMWNYELLKRNIVRYIKREAAALSK